MNLKYPELRSLISVMAEGDLEFESQLTMAIHQGLKELKEKYEEGSVTKNEMTLIQIRHKLKPTLSMFQFHDIIAELQYGKEILETNGFDPAFDAHRISFNSKLEIALMESMQLTI